MNENEKTEEEREQEEREEGLRLLRAHVQKKEAEKRAIHSAIERGLAAKYDETKEDDDGSE
jgi:hypothetical protein